MQGRLCVGKCAKKSNRNFQGNWLFLAFIFTVGISSPWKSVGVECSKTGVETLNKVNSNNSFSVGAGEMTVSSNALTLLRVKKVVDEPTPTNNNTKEGINSTAELGLTTKRSLLGHSETSVPPPKSRTSTTESITEAEKESEPVIDEDPTSLENELEESPAKSLEVVDDANEPRHANSSESESDIPPSDDLDAEIDDDNPNEFIESQENEFSPEETDDDDTGVSATPPPQYKMTNLVTSSASFTTFESNDSPETDIVFVSSTPRSLSKVTYIKKIPTRLIAASNTRIKQKQKLEKLSTTTKRPTKPTTTRRPPKKVLISTSKKPIRVTNAPKPKTTTTPEPDEHKQKNPHHPHGVVVFDRRKKRPRPTRRTTTTTTTTTSTTTEAPAPPSPEPDFDFYDYYLASGENSIEFGGPNSTNSSKTNRIPLSKLALAMLASSAGFDNGTEDLMYFPKTPVNLLNILQAYTKQLQVASTETFKPPVKIERQPFIMHLGGLNFAQRVGISVYYSLIAIIPLVYLAFGGLGRLGFASLVGRNLGFVGRRRKRRRKRRSFDEDYYHYYGAYNNHFSKGTFQANTIKRIHLKDRTNEDDEYSWILGRISEVILELSQVPYDLEHRM